MPTSTNPAKPAAETHQDPYRTLRDGLISGRWRSGERLKPLHLKTELQCSPAALREALLQLAAEGFVEAEKHQGFRAVTHSEGTFREAVHLRQLLECEATDLALSNGDFDWEMQVNTAHHNLAYIEAQMLRAGDVTDYLQKWSMLDWAFHHAILAACGSTLLTRYHSQVYDTFRMYAVSRVPDFGFSAHTHDEHRAIYEAAIARNSAACMAAIKAHLGAFEGRVLLGNDG